MDDTEIPGILPTIGFLDASRFAPRELAKLVFDKLAVATEDARIPQTVNSEFNRIMYEGFDFHGFRQKQIAEAVSGKWLIGRQGAWYGRMTDGKYVLVNKTRLSATLNNHLTYHGSDNTLCDLGNGRVSVRVRLLPPFSAHSSAGLMFRGSTSSSSYLAFYRTPGRAISLCKVTDGKLEKIWSDEVPEIDDGDFCRLTMSGLRDRVELSVDSAQVFVYSCKIRGPAVGTSVFGTGVFEFDDFAMYARVTR